jgi:protein-S-isoprenylcysteine O-methyltransferase Ste14
MAHLATKRPELFRRRLRAQEGTETWDRILAPLLKLAWSGALLTAAFDAGPVGRSPMPSGFWPLGAVLHLLGFALFTWAMLVNPHFESTVRIQGDRDHRTVDRGPYRIVRHPGYSGFALLLVAIPVVLGSWWAFVPVAVAIGLLLLRTALEDRMLQGELEGYAAYAARVRYRILPGVW